MKRIKVQSRLSKAAALLIVAIIVALGIFFVYLDFTSDFISSGTSSDIYGFVAMAIIFVPIILSQVVSKSEYVSELIIANGKLIIVYKSSNSKRERVINLDDITKFKAILSANDVRSGKSSYVSCTTDVTIQTKNDGEIEFIENSSASFSFCAYSFLLRLINLSKYIPNFSYTVVGNSKFVREDIKYFAIHGRRIPFLKYEYMRFKSYPMWSKFLLVCCVVPFIISLGVLIYLTVPNYVSSEDKEYVSYIEQGYHYYQDNLYDASIKEYDKALRMHDNDSTLYYYRALTYYYDKQYEKGYEEAKKGIECLNQKSIYRKAKNWKFVGNNDIGLYTTMGNCAGHLKQYREAIEAYDYVVNHVKYTYSDVYFKRGKCKYYLGLYNEALEDFYHHQQIIQQYFDDQKSAEYKDKYPRYSNNDLADIQAWIDSCK